MKNGTLEPSYPPSPPTLTHSTFAAGRLVGDRQKTWLRGATCVLWQPFEQNRGQTELLWSFNPSTHPNNLKKNRIWESIGVIFTLRCTADLSHHFDTSQAEPKSSVLFHTTPPLFGRKIYSMDWFHGKDRRNTFFFCMRYTARVFSMKPWLLSLAPAKIGTSRPEKLVNGLREKQGKIW